MIKHLLVWVTAAWISVSVGSSVSAEGPFADGADASPQWKQDKVLYTYGQCLSAVNDAEACRQIIKDTSKLEDANAIALITTIRDFDVNLAQFDKQSAACRRHPGYKAFVDCHVALLERLKDEIAGQTLLAE